MVKFIVIIISVLFFQEHQHSPYGAKSFYDPLLYKDTLKIKNNVITFVVKNDSCTTCHKWYTTRQNVDTFSTIRKAKYSNLKYKKH